MNTDELKHAIEMYVMGTYVEKAQERIMTQLLNKLTELERLAEIGRATENLLEFTSFEFQVQSKNPNAYTDTILIKNTNDLLEWAKED